MGFQQGLSGLNASSKNLEVIGNNVANANTFGAKASRAEFADVYANALNGAGANTVGIGTNLQTVAQQFTQGNITTTENPMDMAINGNGFFQVTDGKNPVMYTRNGQFKVDREGYIVNNESQRLVGYPADAAGVVQPGQAVPLQLPTGGINPNPTGKIELEMNLDSRLGIPQAADREATAQQAEQAAQDAVTARDAADAALAADPTNPTLIAAAAAAAANVTTTAAAAAAARAAVSVAPQINFSDPTTYNKATSQTIYDAKGQDVALTYYFQKSGTDTWNVFVTANGKTVSGTDTAPTPVTTMTFPSNGKAPTSPAAPVPLVVTGNVTNAAGAQIVTPLSAELNLAGVTQYGAPFSVTKQVQDGYAPGQLTDVAIEGNGVIMARYSNGQSKPAGQIELATFRNPQGLQPLGGNLWARTYASGDPTVSTPGDGSVGKLQAGALEESNVDLTGELVNMITAQRVYQANAQTIKTEDQILQTLVNLR
jgi:flagellar hook protein FlgE